MSRELLAEFVRRTCLGRGLLDENFGDRADMARKQGPDCLKFLSAGPDDGSACRRDEFFGW